MPLTVNRQFLSEQAIAQETNRLRRQPDWAGLAASAEGEARLRAAAEYNAIGDLLFRQAVEQDREPLDETEVRKEFELQQKTARCRTERDAYELRGQVEHRLRCERVIRRLIGDYPLPDAADVKRFYAAHREKFLRPETVRVAHIVKHVRPGMPEQTARSGVEAALAELERGESFAEVVRRYSDCGENGGELGPFARGAMVEEFERVVFALQPGERSGIFRTPFGFHIAVLIEKSPLPPAGFDEVQESVARVLDTMARHEAFDRAVAVLRTRAEIGRLEATHV